MFLLPLLTILVFGLLRTGAFRAPVLKAAVKTILQEYYVEHELDEVSEKHGLAAQAVSIVLARVLVVSCVASITLHTVYHHTLSQSAAFPPHLRANLLLPPRLPR